MRDVTTADLMELSTHSHHYPLYARTDSERIEDGEALTEPCPGHEPVDLTRVP